MVGVHFPHQQVCTQHIGLGLFQGEGFVAQGLGHRSLPIDGFLHAQAFCHFPVHDVPIKGIGVQVSLVHAFKQQHAGREYGAVEFLADNVVEQDGPGTVLLLHARIIRKIDGDGLVSGIGIAAIIDDIAGENVGFESGSEKMVGRIPRQGGLQFRKTGADGLHLLRTLLILQEHVGAIGGLDAQKFIVNGFRRTDYKVHLAVHHIQPGQIALVVIVGHHGIGLFEEVVPDTGLDGDVGGSSQEVGYFLHLLLVCLVVPDRFQLAVLLPADEGVGAVFVRIRKVSELLDRHILRIKTGAGRLGAVTREEGLVVDAVPGAVIQQREGSGIRVFQIVESFPGTEVLLPVDGIGLVCCKTVQVENLFAIVRDSRKVRSGNGHRCVILQITCPRRNIGFAGNHQEGRQSERNCYFFLHRV